MTSINLTVTLMLLASSLHHIQARQPVSQDCLTCICHAASNCNSNKGCSGGSCGFFQLTKPQWQDAGSIVVSGSSKDSKAFETCALDPVCASRTVQSYMVKYKKDCTGDGQVSCTDYLALHFLGAGCRGSLSKTYPQELKAFKKCREAQIAG